MREGGEERGRRGVFALFKAAFIERTNFSDHTRLNKSSHEAIVRKGRQYIQRYPENIENASKTKGRTKAYSKTAHKSTQQLVPVCTRGEKAADLLPNLLVI